MVRVSVDNIKKKDEGIAGNEDRSVSPECYRLEWVCVLLIITSQQKIDILIILSFMMCEIAYFSNYLELL